MPLTYGPLSPRQSSRHIVHRHRRVCPLSEGAIESLPLYMNPGSLSQGARPSPPGYMQRDASGTQDEHGEPPVKPRLAHNIGDMTRKISSKCGRRYGGRKRRTQQLIADAGSFSIFIGEEQVQDAVSVAATLTPSFLRMNLRCCEVNHLSRSIMLMDGM